MTSPKAEIRSPKEARKPRAEAPAVAGASVHDSEFWTWGGDPVGESLVLKEDGEAAQPPPRDLLERTARFGETIVRFAKKIPQNPVNNRLIDQLVGAGTSVPANYCVIFGAIWRKRQ